MRIQRERAQNLATTSKVPSDAPIAQDRPTSRSIMRQSSAAEAARTAGRPRLQVDLLDLAQMEPSLRTSMELTSEPATDPRLAQPSPGAVAHAQCIA
ncbi:MAG: hypothetical protein HC858_05180 [Brachymonas sp.]|nr:hypothetical protein [Brachymonas sp.]